MKLRCKCDEQIRDQSDLLPHKPRFYSDEDEERLSNEMLDAILALTEAAGDSARDAWRARHLPGLGAPQDPLHYKSENDQLLHLLSMRYRGRYLRTMYQCESCGRLFLQRSEPHHDGGTYEIFAPETDDAKGILASPVASR